MDLSTPKLQKKSLQIWCKTMLFGEDFGNAASADGGPRSQDFKSRTQDYDI